MTSTTVLTKTVSIAAGASLAAALDLAGFNLVGIQMPVGWDAAGITFQTSTDNATFGDLYKQDGTEYSVTVASGRDTIISPSDFQGAKFLKVRSGTGAVPVNQTAARTITLLLRAMR
jgi:hypothetical protein